VTRRLERDLHQALEPIAPIEYVDEAAESAEAIADALSLPAPSMVLQAAPMSQLAIAA
jgi:hypothetical protein